ncbi:MAG: FkbM family methyltransferase [Rubrivivax sp.]|nr:FkbM family methyltransferase [Rubrivivax sp.]
MPNLNKNLVVALARLTARAVGQLSKDEVEQVARHIGHQRQLPCAEEFAFFAKCLQTEYFGISNRTAENGELWMMKATAPLAFKTVFDVGANVGKWTTHLLGQHPAASVHCFEIVPTTFSILSENLKDKASQVVLNQFGLGESDAEITMHVDPNNLTISSAYDFGSQDGKVQVLCKIRSASDYFKTAGLKGIDFLKIDVEGAEAMVIRGFRDQLAARQVRLLQFEYNRGSLESGVLLKDFYAMLKPLGYQLGKLYPNGVKFQDYSWEHEDFMGPNYVACLPDDRELIKLISIR